MPINPKSTIAHRILDNPITYNLPIIIEGDVFSETLSDSLLPDLTFELIKSNSFPNQGDFLFYSLNSYFTNAEFTSVWFGEFWIPKEIEDSVLINSACEFKKEVTLVFYEEFLGWDYNISRGDTILDRNYGIKITKNDSIYYGWVNFEFYNNSFKLIEYAYNLKSNEPIKAGQKY